MKSRVARFVGSICALVAITAAFTAAQPSLLQIGDSLYPYMQKNLVRFRMPGGNICPWVEGQNIALLTYQRGVDPLKPSFLLSHNVPFGVLQGTPPNAYYLFDTDGDGVLDYHTEQALLPIWLVSYFSRTVDSSSTELRHVFDLFFEAFQSDSGLPSNKLTKPAFQAIFAGRTDTLQPNRDLFYMLYYYLIFTEKDPSQALMAMRALETRYRSRFHAIHPLIKLYELESAIQTKDFAAASGYLSELISLDSNFIPGQYYSYVLETDPSIKASKATSLRSRYPSHWIIRRMKK